VTCTRLQVPQWRGQCLLRERVHALHNTILRFLVVDIHLDRQDRSRKPEQIVVLPAAYGYYYWRIANEEVVVGGDTRMAWTRIG